MFNYHRILRAASFQICEDNGTASTQPARGSTRTTGISNVNLKSIDDTSSSYASYPITGGTNSYSKFISFLFTGTYNTISDIKFQHTGGNLGAGLSLMVATGASGFYTTPSQTTNSVFTVNLTSTGLASTGISVHVGGTGINANAGPNCTGKANSTTANPAWSSYVGLQLQTTTAATAGDFANGPILYSIQYLEN
jgi:hypothetical protein